MSATIVEFPSGGPPDSRKRHRESAPPAGDIVEVVRLDRACGQDENALFGRSIRISQTLLVPPDGANGAAEFVSKLLLAPAFCLSPSRKLHSITCPSSTLPKWLYLRLAMWQYANMAKGQIVYIRVVANDDDAPNRIQELIDAAGISQAELARMANVTVSALNKVVKGSRGLDQEWMRRLAPHLGVSPAELLPKSENAFLLSDEEKALIERLRHAPSSVRNQFAKVADALIPDGGRLADTAA